MERQISRARPNLKEKFQDFEYLVYSEKESYWNENACYRFTREEVDRIEAATNTLQELCAEAVQIVFDRDWCGRLGLSELEKQLAYRSWENDEFSIYGRFDLSLSKEGWPMMLEYNADTPTSLFEAGVLQWEWLKETRPGKDQFNSIHEKLKARWPAIAKKSQKLYFTCLRENAEDITQTEYLRDTAHQAGFNTQFIFIDELGWSPELQFFDDLEEQPIPQVFKLYPWEWLTKDEFGPELPLAKTKFIEPAWKRILSTKAILPILWELFPDCPYLLPASFEKPASGNFVKKPTVSREGSGIEIIADGKTIERSEATEESAQFIYQAYQPLPVFSGQHAVIGSWIIGEEAAGMGVREDSSAITKNTSRFVPHYFE